MRKPRPTTLASNESFWQLIGPPNPKTIVVRLRVHFMLNVIVAQVGVSLPHLLWNAADVHALGTGSFHVDLMVRSDGCVSPDTATRMSRASTQKLTFRLFPRCSRSLTLSHGDQE